MNILTVVLTSSRIRRLSPDDFRHVIGHFTSGVTVVTARVDGRRYGTTASAVTSLSLDPPMLLVCLNRDSETGRAIAESRRFAVNILSDAQTDQAIGFGQKGPDKFARASLVEDSDPDAPPLLANSLATLDCRVVETTEGGTHAVFVAKVDRGVAGTGAPLAYYRGQFGRLEIEPGSLARGPLSLGAVLDALDARTTIELGVVRLRAGTLTDHEFGECQRMAQGLRTIGTDGAPVPGREWIGAVADFLDRVVGLVGSEALLGAYRRADIPGVLLRLRGPDAIGDVAPSDLDGEHLAFVAALAAGEVDEATAIIERRRIRLAEVLRAEFARRAR